MRRTALFLLALCWGACPAHAQRVAGTVTDTHGAAIQGATVRVTAPGFDATATTDADGRFEVADTTSVYTISFEAPGFETYSTRLNILPTPAGPFDVTLTPKAQNDTEIVLITVADAASRRPQYLPGTGLRPGAPFVATGLFRVASTLQASGDPATELDGFKIEFTNSDGGSHLASLISVGPNQIQGVLPTDMAAGTWTVTVRRGDQPSRGGSIRVGGGNYAPNIFTRNSLGFGTALATDEAGDPITFTNPARPGGVVRLVTSAGANEYHGQLYVSTRVETTWVGYDTLGRSEVRVNIPGDLTERETGCAVPFLLGWPDETRAPRYGNQVTLPISRSGPCTDTLGFGPADSARLGGSGINILEASITEGTLLQSGTRRDGTFGRITANNWTWGNYGGVAPIDACYYRWEPRGFRNPDAPTSLALGGTASVTVPWGQFNFSPTSNAGPFSLAFANPANFSEGNYRVDFPSAFTAGGGSHTSQATGPYRRPAGRLRNSLATRAAEQDHWRGLSLNAFIDRVIQTIIEGSQAVDLAEAYVDFNVLADDGTKGRYAIRCVADLAKRETDHGALLKRIFREALPERTNTTDVSIRFFPKEPIRYDHSGSAIDRTFLTFDSFVGIQGLDGNR